MSPSLREICEIAKGLPDIEKAELVEQLLSQLDIPDPRVQQVWAEEVGRRVVAAKEGRLESFSYEEIMDKYLQP